MMKLLFLIYMFLQQGQAVEQEVVSGIGIKLCSLKCSEKGSCMSFAYNIERLECRLSFKEDTKLVKEGYIIRPKKGKEVSANACSLLSCGPDTQCVKRRSGDTVCVKALFVNQGEVSYEIVTLSIYVSEHADRHSKGVEVTPEDTGRNIALGQPTIQSSTLNNLGKAEGAVDGSHLPRYIHGSCSHTSFYAPYWWIVDLNQVYIINQIVIYNREQDQERLDNTMVEGFLHYPAMCDNTNASSSVFHVGPSGNVVNVSFERSTRAQFIRISRRGVLTLCEVEVYGVVTYDQGRIDSQTEVKTGIKLRGNATALGRVKDQEACLSACKKLPNCYFVNHNARNGECLTAAGLVKMEDFKPSSHWNLYSLC